MDLIDGGQKLHVRVTKKTACSGGLTHPFLMVTLFNSVGPAQDSAVSY